MSTNELTEYCLYSVLPLRSSGPPRRSLTRPEGSSSVLSLTRHSTHASMEGPLWPAWVLRHKECPLENHSIYTLRYFSHVWHTSHVLMRTEGIFFKKKTFTWTISQPQFIILFIRILSGLDSLFPTGIFFFPTEVMSGFCLCNGI